MGDRRASQPDQDGSFSYRIDWDGNGTFDETVNGDDSVNVPHVYPQGGSFTIRATSTDRDSGESAVATRGVTVNNTARGVQPDPRTLPCGNPLSGDGRRNRLTGTALGDEIRALGGRDRIRGLAGDDCLYPGGGRDRINAGEGTDFVDARGGGRDIVNCGPGGDTATASKKDRLRGCERVNPANP